PQGPPQHCDWLQLPVASEGPQLGLEHGRGLAGELLELARRAAAEPLHRLERLGAPLLGDLGTGRERSLLVGLVRLPAPNSSARGVWALEDGRGEAHPLMALAPLH